MRAVSLVPSSETPRFPCFGSPKLDGFRCVVVDGKALSKTLKPVRNARVQKALGIAGLNGLDGELVVGRPTEHPDDETTVLGRTMSGVTSGDGDPDFKFYVFDRWDRPTRPFSWRSGSAEDIIDDFPKRPLSFVPQRLLRTWPEVLSFEEEMLAAGYEGVCLRPADSPYKYGKVTPKEGWLLKMKRFTDGEATVLEVRPAMSNQNEAERTPSGKLVRSTSAVGRTASLEAGKLRVQDLATGQDMLIGTGRMPKTMRVELLERPERAVGKVVTWRYFGYGVLNAARHAHFVAFRHEDDLAP
jgi:DNA ligase-1